MEAWSDGLARLPASFHVAREELLALMRKEAILHESPTQPILSRDGTTARWMLNSLAVTLTARGAELAGPAIPLGCRNMIRLPGSTSSAIGTRSTESTSSG